MSPPRTVIHAPGDGRSWRAEFGEDTGQASALDKALHAAGAMFPSMRDTDEVTVAAYYEEHGERLAPAVFAAVGAYCGLSIDPAEARAGELPSLLIPMV